MSIVSFLMKGTGPFESFKRSAYPSDSIQKFNDVDLFTGLVTNTVQEGEKKTVTIDNAYVFAVISDSVRNNCVSLWGKLENNCFKVFIITGLIGTIGLISAVAGVAPTLLVPVISVIFLGIAILAKYRESLANNEMKLWEDPTMKYIEDCHKYNLLAQANKQASATQKAWDDHLQLNVKMFKDSIAESLDKIRKNAPEHRNNQQHKLFAESFYECIKNVMKMHVDLEDLTIDKARELLTPYFEEFPDLESTVFGIS